MKSTDIESAFIPVEELKKQQTEEEKVKKKKPKTFVDHELDKMASDSPEMMDKDLLFTKEIIKELTSLKDLDTRTDLTQKEILLFARLQFFAEIFGLPELKDFAVSVYRKKFSKNRGLRKEILQAIVQIQHADSENVMTFPDMLLGGKK